MPDHGQKNKVIMKLKKITLKNFPIKKPLLPKIGLRHANKYTLTYYGFNKPKEFEAVDAMICQKINIESMGKIVFGSKVASEQLEKFDFLGSYDGPNIIAHQRVVAKLNELCPNDFQALPAVIRNYDAKQPAFENKSFWVINILNEVDVIDRVQSQCYYKGASLRCKNMHLKSATSMQDHLMARIKDGIAIVFHPTLAKHFIPHKDIEFYEDTEWMKVRPYRDETWFYLNRFYAKVLCDHGVYEEFYEPDGFMKTQNYIDMFEDEIFMNYCPNCKNLKKTPQARQCLACGEFHDPIKWPKLNIAPKSTIKDKN